MQRFPKELVTFHVVPGIPDSALDFTRLASSLSLPWGGEPGPHCDLKLLMFALTILKSLVCPLPPDAAKGLSLQPILSSLCL